MHFSPANRSNTLNGVFFVALFALSSIYLAEMSWMMALGIHSLVIAIILGMIYSNTLRHKLPKEWTPGIQFSAKQLLRLAIIFYGFRINFQQIASIGMDGLILDIFIVGSTLIIGTFLGVKLFKIDHHLALLISAGAAICGAAAVLAVEDILKSEPYKATVGVGTVVLFGILGMFLYPLLQHMGFFGFNDTEFGLFVGASIHEVAQVVVAGNGVSSEASNIGVVVKMTRVLLLVPALFLLSIYSNRFLQKNKNENFKISIPWFAVLFVVMIGINSLQIFPIAVVNFINQFDNFLLTMAMAAIGIETNLAKLKHVGLNPLYLASLLFLWLMGSAFILVKVL